MFEILMALMGKIGPGAAALPEFARLVEQVKATLSSDKQEDLQRAYDLACDRSDEAHNDLQKLVAERTGG